MDDNSSLVQLGLSELRCFSVLQKIFCDKLLILNSCSTGAIGGADVHFSNGALDNRELRDAILFGLSLGTSTRLFDSLKLQRY